MKKGLLHLCAVLCLLGSLSSCEEDKDEVPPVIADVIAEYAAENLKGSVDGVELSSNAKIVLAESATSDKVTIKLFNIVPGAPELEVPNADFAVTTRSAYISTLKGEVTDNESGYVVKVDGTVDEKVLTANITLTEIVGDSINTKSLYNLVYKGNMDITVGGVANPAIEQRVYVTKSSKIGTTQKDTSMVKFTIKNFSFQGLPLGDINVDTVLIQKRGDVLGFKAEKRIIKLNQIGDVDANLYGSIVGDEIKLNLDIDASGLKVGVVFGGATVTEAKTAKITKMTIDGPAILGQKMGGTTSLTIKIWEDTPAEQLLLTPVYELAEKTTIDSVQLYRRGQPSILLTNDQIIGKAPIDFSLLKVDKNDFIKYWLAAEDPNVKGSFIIYVERIENLVPVYDMQTWVEDAGNNKPTPKGLTNSNLAANFFPMLGIDVPIPVVKASDNAAEITTSRTVSETMPNGMVPGVTAGTLFLGKFSLDMLNTLKSTHFGAPYRGKPVNFKMTYKYTPGTIYYRNVTEDSVNDTEIVPNTIDECSINAYLYEVSNYDETLDGTNINTSAKVILKAVLPDGTAKSAYTTETIPFKETGNGTYDPAKKYKLAIVCSSSKRGDEFMGADGSQLWVKSLEVTTK